LRDEYHVFQRQNGGETKRSGVVTQKCDGDRVYLLPRKKEALAPLVFVRCAIG
jgi:hypothetical protein